MACSTKRKETTKQLKVRPTKTKLETQGGGRIPVSHGSLISSREHTLLVYTKSLPWSSGHDIRDKMYMDGSTHDSAGRNVRV